MSRLGCVDGIVRCNIIDGDRCTRSGINTTVIGCSRRVACRICDIGIDCVVTLGKCVWYIDGVVAAAIYGGGKGLLGTVCICHGKVDCRALRCIGGTGDGRCVVIGIVRCIDTEGWCGGIDTVCMGCAGCKAVVCIVCTADTCIHSRIGCKVASGYADSVGVVTIDGTCVGVTVDCKGNRVTWSRIPAYCTGNIDVLSRLGCVDGIVRSDIVYTNGCRCLCIDHCTVA